MENKRKIQTITYYEAPTFNQPTKVQRITINHSLLSFNIPEISSHKSYTSAFIPFHAQYTRVSVYIMHSVVFGNKVQS